MKTRLVISIAAVLLVSAAAGAVPLTEMWLRVQQTLGSPGKEEFEERIQELREAGVEADARRLTPYASALTAWTAENSGEPSSSALSAAQKLDPLLPSPRFLEARWQWRQGSYPGAVVTYLGAWVRVLRFGQTRHALLASMGVCLLFAVGLSFAVSALLIAGSHLRVLVHDAFELGRLLFSRGNALVFGVVVLTLPLFAGLGPAWLVAFVFALTWFYLKRAQLAGAIVCSLVLALFLPALETWQYRALRSEPVTTRVVRMLEERRVDFSTLREFADLEQELGEVGVYHFLLGELLRMHGEALGARVQFQKAAVADPSSERPLISLGNLAMEDGDPARAIQQYNAALALEPESALAYYNLSFAYDQSRLFQEGDQARNRARELAGRRLESLGVVGQTSRIRYPRLGKPEVRQLTARVTPEMRLAASMGGGVRLQPLNLLLSPLSAAFWVTGLIGVVLLVARKRWMWQATSCVRCGKVFCPRCKTSTESATFCSQCISVFLKQDVVSIEQQQAKMAQIRRWERFKLLGYRAAGFIFPASRLTLEGKVWSGLGLGFLIWFSLIGALIWAPSFLPSIAPMASVLPIQVCLILAFVLLWGRSVVSAWKVK